MLFRDRSEAGRRLAQRLAQLPEADGDSLILALPRGGVPVAAPVAEELGAELDLLVVRKLGLPGHSELAMGALATGGVRVLNEEIVEAFEVDPSVIEQVTEREREELRRREQLYRGERPAAVIAGRQVILIDDGLATGASMRVAIQVIRNLSAHRLIMAVPVAAPDVCAALTADVDEAVCLETPAPFIAVGRWYESFPQTGDDEVRELLERARTRAWAGP